MPPLCAGDKGDYDHGELGVRDDMYHFLAEFIAAHPEYAAAPFYVFGESYGGMQPDGCTCSYEVMQSHDHILAVPCYRTVVLCRSRCRALHPCPFRSEHDTLMFVCPQGTTPPMWHMLCSRGTRTPATQPCPRSTLRAWLLATGSQIQRSSTSMPPTHHCKHRAHYSLAHQVLCRMVCTH